MLVLGIAAAVALLHVLTNQRYGLHRDELQFLSDARHLDWGFVAYPPVIAQAVTIVITGMMAREVGGARLAQVTAALAIALSPRPLFEGASAHERTPLSLRADLYLGSFCSAPIYFPRRCGSPACGIRVIVCWAGCTSSRWRCW